MADSAIDVTSPAPPAWLERALRAVRGVKPVWLVVVTLLGFGALCVVAADAGAGELRAVHAQETERIGALTSALDAQRLHDARAAIQLEDLRAQAAAQQAELDSVEGFLK